MLGIKIRTLSKPLRGDPFGYYEQFLMFFLMGF